MLKPKPNLNRKPSLTSSVFCFSPEPEAANEADKYCFKTNPMAIGAVQEGKTQRTFSGIAYSGEPITDHWYWDQVIFDLDTIEIKGRIPALLEHNRNQRAGAINDYSTDHKEGLKVSGVLMSNEFGAQVAQDSDDTFPWQMSVRIMPTSIEEFAAGQAVTVNGKTYQGPITVFRGGRIREVSFCALGADDNTSAVAASHAPKTFNQEDTNVTELEQANARIKELEGQVTGLQNQNKQFAADKREAEIAALSKDLGLKEFSAEDKADYLKLDDAGFAFAAKQARAIHQQFSGGQQQKPALNPALFSHQATGGQEQQNQGGSALDAAFNNFSNALDKGK